MYEDILTKIRQPRMLKDNLYEIIRRVIVEAKIKPGEKINIEEMGRNLGVSRTPLREVLHCLQTEGLIRFVPRLGPVVEEISLKEVSDAYVTRLSLEKLALDLAFPRITLSAIKRLEETISQTEKSISKRDPQKVAELNERFHFIIYDLSGNSLLQKYMKDIFTKIARCISLLSYEDTFTLSATDDHRKILKALKDEGLPIAKELIEKHINSSYENLRILLGKQIAKEA